MGLLSLPVHCMVSERRAGAFLLRAPAKVNLFLEVLGKRADSYHEIATLMVAVTLHDLLTFKEDASGEVRLACDRADLPGGADNLVVRAALLLQQRTGCRRGAAITLRKRIPIAAGLAGGSSDAAATLTGLNRLWRLGLSREELAGLGAELGSDVPFFFSPPAAWCTGRGEKVMPVPLGSPLWFVLLCLPWGLATADVYRAVTVPERPADGSGVLRAAAAGNVEALGRGLFNRLWEPAVRLRPKLTEWLNRLDVPGALGRAMSGSGTSLFALCHDRRQALRVARGLRPGPEEGGTPRVFIVCSCP
jgi:4-diphosphocytidyl-2-C-methyl-D-erythritol kinase